MLGRRKVVCVSEPIPDLTLNPTQGVVTPKSGCKNGKHRANSGNFPRVARAAKAMPMAHGTGGRI